MSNSASKDRLPLDQVTDLIIRQNLQKADERLADLENAKTLTSWVAYSPTIVNGPSVVAFSKCFWRRVGDSIEVKGTATFGSADGNGNAVELKPIPSGLSVDTAKISADEVGTCGTMRYFRTGTGNYPGIAIQRTTGSLVFQPSYTASSFIASMLQSGDRISWHATIPIAQYA